MIRLQDFNRRPFDCLSNVITITVSDETLTADPLAADLFIYLGLNAAAHNSRACSVTLNLANKFSQCTFSVAEHYDLFSDLIILRQA